MASCQSNPRSGWLGSLHLLPVKTKVKLKGIGVKVQDVALVLLCLICGRFWCLSIRGPCNQKVNDSPKEPCIIARGGLSGSSVYFSDGQGAEKAPAQWVRPRVNLKKAHGTSKPLRGLPTTSLIKWNQKEESGNNGTLQWRLGNGLLSSEEWSGMSDAFIAWG